MVKILTYFLEARQRKLVIYLKLYCKYTVKLADLMLRAFSDSQLLGGADR